MSVTIEEIAKLANVSKTTVSRVLNNKPDVSPGTRTRILALIAEYDFQPNVFAKAITLQKSHNIGLIIPHDVDYIFSNQFYVEVLRGVSTAVDRHGYHLLLCYLHGGNFVNIYKQKKVDGFIVMSPGSPHQNIIESLKRVGAPFVSTAKISAEEEMVYVDVDNFLGATLAIEHLVSLGHRRIAFVGKPALRSSLDRLHGYQHVLEQAGISLDEELVKIAPSSSIDGGYQTTMAMLTGKKIPTAMFLTNDVMAYGAVKAIQDSGLRVPEDISVVGFDDVPLALYTTPPLTTVRQPAYEKGDTAADLLIQYLDEGQIPESRILEVELIIRGSTAICPD
jgi:LacI family transcriptional regulator